MQKPFLLCLFLLVLARCGSGEHVVQKTPSATPSSSGQLVRGSFQMSPGLSRISDCGTGKQYVVQSAPALDSLFQLARGPIIYPEKTVYAVLRGHLRGDTLTVTDVDAMESKHVWNTCIPFEFWCSGTEPFWDLEISQAEGGLFYQDASRQVGTKYAWTAPKTDGNTWTYTAPATTDGQPAIRVVIKKEAANNGMSDITFNYSAELTVGGEKRKGVAIRWGEPKLEPKN